MVATSIIALFGLGFLAAAVLAVASRLLAVEEDPRVEAVVECLPGANCGGCGFAGCESYAAAVINNADIPANLCVAGGPETSDKVGVLSGKAVEQSEPLVSFRRCSREEGGVRRRYEYYGSGTCKSAAMLEGGPYMCTWSCMGLGDCMRACPFDAMYMKDGMVEIIRSKCVSCGVCVKICPRHILQLIPARARVMSHCATRERMKEVTEVCSVGCINCLQCVKKCPANAISYQDLRVEIDHKACMEYGPACAEICVTACPRHIMRRRTAPVVLDSMDNLAQVQPGGSANA